MITVFDRLPNAKDYANKVVFLPEATSIPKNPNREQPGVWVSDGRVWKLLVASESDGTFNVQTKDPEPFPDIPTLFKYTNILWVDPNGDDSTGAKGEFNKPYKTITAAQAAADADDAISIMPGTYNEFGLGKQGVTYLVYAGTVLAPVGGDLFVDGGENVSFTVLGPGEIIGGDDSRIANLSGTGKVVFDVRHIDSTWNISSPGGEYPAAIQLKGSVKVGIRTEQLDYSGTTRLISIDGGESTTPQVYIKTNNISSTCTLVLANDGGQAFVDYNYAFCNNTNNTREFMACGGGYLIVNGRYTEDAVTNNMAFAICESSLAGTGSGRGILKWTGDITYNGTHNVLETQEDPCILEYTGRLEVTSSTNGNAIVQMVRPGILASNNSILKLNNAILIHKGQLASSQGINLGMTSVAGQANVEFNNVRIALHSTAVGLGAKALDKNGKSTNIAAYTDTLSNGVIEGNNLISGIFIAVDPNIKSE